MIIYSKEPLNVMMKNILLLDDPFTSGYVYVSKETFEQALSLKITYNDDVSRVRATISGKGMLNWAANKVISHVVDLCATNFCAPINMLAPYLAYTHAIGIDWPESDEEIVSMAYGVLHQMSQFINFYGVSLMPAAGKADIMIPKNIIMAYEDSWKAQLDSLDKCVVAVPVYVNGATPVVQTAVPAVTIPVQTTAPVLESPVSADTTKALIEEEDDDDIKVQPRTAVVNDTEKTKEVVQDVQAEASGETEEAEEETVPDSKEEDAGEEEQEVEEDAGGDEGEEDEDDMEAKILALMKGIEDAPAEQFQKEPKRETAPEPVKETSKRDEAVDVGDSGSINMTESEIAAGNRRLLNDYDI